jgi:CubicO group peptidase (beta-lactamase class C family)
MWGQVKLAIVLFVLAALFYPSAGISAGADERVRRVENGLIPLDSNGQPGQPANLADRMRFYKVPGVSVAVISRGELQWARGYGVLEAGDTKPVTAETLFQACSISKPVVAVGVLALVQRRELRLDEDVNKKLKTWKVPENQFTTNEKVTLRRLLSHTAGVTGSGFLGYALDEPVPTLPQILDGVSPANSKPIRVDTTPGTQWRYSGGGFLITQQLLTDVTGEQFPQLMRRLVLQKAGMKDSFFEQPLPQKVTARAARGHRESGEKIKGDWNVYPEMAAGGMWTTPADLARLVIELQRSKAGKSEKILSAQSTNEMFAGQMRDFPVEMVSKRYRRQITNQGLGFRLEGAGASARFSHHGGNEGYRCFIVAYVNSGEGAIVMTNSDNGFELIQEIVRSIAKEYGWPHYPQN